MCNTNPAQTILETLRYLKMRTFILGLEWMSSYFGQKKKKEEEEEEEIKTLRTTE